VTINKDVRLFFLIGRDETIAIRIQQLQYSAKCRLSIVVRKNFRQKGYNVSVVQNPTISLADENKLDLNQLFVEFRTPSQRDQPSVSLKIGRQELQYCVGIQFHLTQSSTSS